MSDDDNYCHTVYVAGSSDEIERARHWIERLRDFGVVVTSSWPESMELYNGVANPRGDKKAREAIAKNCYVEVAGSALLWLLAPSKGHGRGAYCELGIAYMNGLDIVVSGDCEQSVFCALGLETSTDEKAFHDILYAVRVEESLENGTELITEDLP